MEYSCGVITGNEMNFTRHVSVNFTMNRFDGLGNRLLTMDDKDAAAGQQTLNFQQTLDLGLQHQNAGQLTEAETQYQKILKADPNHPVALYQLATIARQVGNYGVAIDLIEKTLAITPDFADGFFNLGNIMADLGRLEDAVIYYHRAIAIQPELPVTHYNLGNTLLSLGRLEDAAQSYRNSIALQPKFADVHYNMGLVFQQLGKIEDAAASYERATLIQPDFALAHNNLGLVLLNLGRLDEAVNSCRAALSAQPDLDLAHNNLGLALQKLEKRDEAVARYRRAIALTPNYAMAHFNLGNAYLEMGTLEKSLASYQCAIAAQPDFAEAYHNLGLAFRKSGLLDEALESLSKAARIEPENADTHTNIGIVLHDLGRLDEAITSFHRAITVNFKFVDAWNNLSMAAKAHRFSQSQLHGATGIRTDDFDNKIQMSSEFVLFDYYLKSYRPHEAEDSFHKAMTALPSKDGETLTINQRVDDGASRPQLPDKIVALFHFGRSGTGLLHSLIDGHPEISTIPSIYLQGFFNADVWREIATDGWRYLPQRFAEKFAVLFDANSAKPIPSRFGATESHIGLKEGTTTVGENRDEALSLDKQRFCKEAISLMEGLDKIDPGSFFAVIHSAFEKVIGTKSEKPTVFYHIHNPDNFAKLNFLRYAPDARLVMMVREPVQCCESWIGVNFDENDYNKMVHRMIAMLLSIDQIVFRIQDSIGVRLEDLKTQPEATLGALCDWLGVNDSPSLYQMTAQGKKWWGDPTSPDYRNNDDISPFDVSSIKRPVGTVFSKNDQLVLLTLFYPFSVQFKYIDPDPEGFRRNLKKIRPMLDGLFDFEKVLLKKLNRAPSTFKCSGDYLLLRSCLTDRWEVLNELNTYPDLLPPLQLDADRR